MSISPEKRGLVDIVIVKGNLGREGIAQLGLLLHDIRQRDGRYVVLDLAATRHLASGGLRVILAAARQLQEKAGALVEEFAATVPDETLKDGFRQGAYSILRTPA